MSDSSDVRRWAAEARSTDTAGRMLSTVRDHHFVVDGPVQNGFPGEAVTPGELFLASIANCGVELVQKFAREEGLPLGAVRASIVGEVDLADQPHPEHTLFNRVRLDFELDGVDEDEGRLLVERFKGR